MNTTALHPLADELNATLAKTAPTVLALFSDRGRRAFFPSRGILGQSAEAKSAAINATLGTASEEDGSALCLECLESLVTLPSESFLYAPSFGLPALREAWRDQMLKKNPSLRDQSFSLPVVTNALTHALSVAGALFVEPGDAIILPDLYWDNYELLFHEFYGASLSIFPMFDGSAFNVAGLEQKLEEPGDKKIVLLNFPNNPTGYTAREAESRAIVAALRKAAEAGQRIVVLLDDAYFGLVYEPGVRTESLFSDLANLHPNLLAVKMDGPTKEDYVWGFRVGFITFGIRGADAAALKALESKAAGIVRATISNASSIGQAMLLKAYQHPEYPRQKEAKYHLLRARYERVRAIFQAHPEYATTFVPMPFNSGYFMCVRPIGADAERVRRRLLEKRRTGVIVLSGLIRIAFSSVPLAALEPLFQNLHETIAELQSESHSPSNPNP
jgi:aspartate/methionine/tyrosine aminotransferase